MISPMDIRAWLLDSDPSIRWQVMRDLIDSPQSEWTAERVKVETEGWGARLLSFQDADGQWAGGAYNPVDLDLDDPEVQPGPGQPWTATTHSLSQLRDFGLDPASASARRTVELVGENSRWEEGNQPYWTGEVEPCVNGITVANGSYFGVDMSPVVDRLVGERLADGGWNCDAIHGSRRTSFDTTINVLEGLLAYERASGGTGASREARRSGEEYLLKRELFRRLSTGEPAEDDYLALRNPVRWQYDILRGLTYFRNAALMDESGPDPRLEAAIEQIRVKRQDDGTWLLDNNPRGRVWFDVDDGPGLPSRWITLRALRVLDWADAN
jgi:hypothetical protein